MKPARDGSFTLHRHNSNLSPSSPTGHPRPEHLTNIDETSSIDAPYYAPLPTDAPVFSSQYNNLSATPLKDTDFSREATSQFPVSTVRSRTSSLRAPDLTMCYASTVDVDARPVAPALNSESEREPKSASNRDIVLASSLLASSQPFRCPRPNCSKSYKQAKGLKYHINHGKCSYKPPVLSEQGLSRDILPALDTKDQAEFRLRPYACGVGDCTRRYKTLAGLKYHYKHSGIHGFDGLLLMACGQHDCLPLLSVRRQRSMSSKAAQAVLDIDTRDGLTARSVSIGAGAQAVLGRVS